MSLLILPFPAFDPVLISIGPFAIRWYALAYIFGILFGWLYARAIIRDEAVWGGAPPFKVADFDDFVVWVTLGIVLGGRLGYILFYNFDHFAAHPLEMLEVWKGGMSFHGGFLGCVLAVAIRMGALKRPGLIIGLFAMLYAAMRSFCEWFREPDAQLGFLFNNWLTMGMLLSVPLFLTGAAFAAVALRKPRHQ